MNVKAAQPKILIIGDSRYLASNFVNGVAAYGEAVAVDILQADQYSLDYLRQFDVIATGNSVRDSDVWRYYPQLITRISSIVDEGGSLIVLISNVHPKFSSPVDGWTYVWEFSTPKGYVDYEIVPSALTQGVKGIKGNELVNVFLSGSYPLVLSPKLLGYPDPQGALAVYGFYGKGKYAVLSQDLYGTIGDFGTLFSNIMYWLTGRDIPPPPSVYDLDQKVAELNNTLDHLNSKLLELNNSINQLYTKIPQLGNISEQLAQVVQETNALSQQVNDLTNEIAKFKNQQQPQSLSTYLAIPAILLSIVAITVALKRR
jgi:uncharacterized coiled-coil protein SlyX